MRVFLLSFIPFSFLFSNNFYSHLSYHGYTGIINIPTADITNYKTIEFLYTKQTPYLKRLKNKINYKTNDHSFSIGILPFIEIGGRLSDIVNENRYIIRDLSVNLKIQIPKLNIFPSFLPTFAIGFQDFAGKTGTFKSKYIVATKKIKKLKISLGYGFGSQRLNGLFLGAEYKINNYLYLLADNDTKYKTLAILFNTYNLFNNINISLMISKNINNKFKFGNSFNLGINLKYNLENSIDFSRKEKVIKKAKNLKELVDILDNYEFENIVIGNKKDTLYIEFEDHTRINNLLSYNLILKILSKLNYKNIVLISKKNNVKLEELIVDKKNNKIDLKYNIDSFKPKYFGKNSSIFKARVELYPGIKTFIGTEKGAFDYDLSLKTHIYTNIYKGLTFGIIYNIDLLHSLNFEKNQVFRKYRQVSQIENVMLHYTFKYKNFLNTTHLGIYKNNYLGFLNENSLILKNSILTLKLGIFKNRKTKDTKEITLASYSYYIKKLDANIKIQGGKYFSQDKGFDITFKKFFKENSVYFKYQYSKKNKYIGIGFEIPLNFNFNSKKIQIKGTKDFNHYIRSSIHRDDGSNKIVPNRLNDIDIKFNNENYYLNRGRDFKSFYQKNILF